LAPLLLNPGDGPAPD